ncbi:PEP-CTERM sorting domain-containing protein [Novipirellula herctigrandis]
MTRIANNQMTQFPTRRGKSILAFAFCIVFAGWGASFVRGEVAYEFTKVADRPIGNAGNLGLFPGLNNNNQVSYVVRSSLTTGDIMRWDSGASVNLGTGSFITQVPINDAGAIAFDNGSKGYVADDTGVVELFSSSRGVDVYGINASGDVVAALENSSGNYEVRTRRAGGSSRRIFSDASNSEYLTYGSGGPPSPDINASGDVVARGTLRETFRDGIHIHTSSGIITVDDTLGPLRRFGNIVDINDSGDVAYYGTPDDQISSAVRDLYLYTSGVGSSIIADHSDFNSISEAGMVINNHGDVLFNATAGGVAGLFIGGNPATDRVLSVGATLDGGVATSLLVREGMLNDAGNFVFTAYLDDNMDGTADRNAVFFASATAVPEPSSLALFAMTAFVFVKRKRRR